MRFLVLIALLALILGFASVRGSPTNEDAPGEPGAVASDPEAARSAPRGNDRLDRRDEGPNSRLCASAEEPFTARTRVSLRGRRWCINDELTNRGTRAEGLLMNVRMVNAVFEDRRKPDFDPDANTDRFLAHLPDYAAHGVNAFTLCLQGGMPGYEGAVNSAFEPDGSLRESYLARVRRVIEACDRAGLVVILGCFYQRQDQVLADEAAVRAGVVNVAQLDPAPRLPQRRPRDRQRVRPRRLRPPPDPHRGGRGRADPPGEEDRPRPARLHQRPGPRPLPRRAGRGRRLPPDPLQRHAARRHPGPDRGPQAIREADRLQRGPEGRRGRRAGRGALRGERGLVGLDGREGQPALPVRLRRRGGRPRRLREAEGADLAAAAARSVGQDVLPAARIRRAAGASSTTRIPSAGSPAWTRTS